MVTSANDNATYHLTELNGSRLPIPISGKREKIFKKWEDENPYLNDRNDEKGGAEPSNMSKVKEDMDETDFSP